MVRTKEGLFAEMAAAMIVGALIPELEKAAPESSMLRALREALRVAHPAVFDQKANPELHADFKAGIGRDPQGLLAGLRLPESPMQEPTPAAASSAGTSSASSSASPFTPQEAEQLRKLLAKAAPAAVPGDETTPSVG
jgi:hypothetical protein